MNIVEIDRKVKLNRKTFHPPMQWNTDGEVPFLVFPAWEQLPKLCHGFTTRLGGVSEGIFSSLNLSFQRGDKKEHVEENFRRLAGSIGTTPDRFVASDQTHTANLRIVTKTDAGKGIVRAKDYSDVDGLITNETDLVLFLSFADCVPVYFYDPVHNVIALSHSGWKGTVQEIGKRTVWLMEHKFQSRPGDILAAIGPSICRDCYEVSSDVADQFSSLFPAEQDQILIPKGKGKYQLDLWKANEYILLSAGIKKEHLTITDLCTCCNKELLFSHRGSCGKRGNLGAFLLLRP